MNDLTTLMVTLMAELLMYNNENKNESIHMKVQLQWPDNRLSIPHQVCWITGAANMLPYKNQLVGKTQA